MSATAALVYQIAYCFAAAAALAIKPIKLFWLDTNDDALEAVRGRLAACPFPLASSSVEEICVLHVACRDFDRLAVV